MSPFLLAVRHLRWLARIPLMPQIFDGLLLAFTAMFHPERLLVMEALEEGALRIPGVHPRLHRFGGVEFCLGGRGELGHMHGHGLLDVRLQKSTARAYLEAGKAIRHHVLPDSGWVSFQLKSPSDVPAALELLKTARSERLAPRRRVVPVVGLEPTR